MRIRALAYIIDFFIFGVVNAIIAIMVGLVLFAVLSLVSWLIGGEYVLGDNPARLYDFFATIVLIITFFALFEWRFMATPGKWLLRMRVVNYKSVLKNHPRKK